jgi:hypothetical protein
LRSKVFSCLVLLVFLANFSLFAQQVSSDPSPAESSLERIPLLFEPNRGQAENSAQFVSRGNGYTVFLATDKTELVLPPTRDVKGQGMKSELSVITLEFLRANKRVRLEAADLLPGKSNYFIGNGSSNWIAGVPQYARINLKSIYPGIDLVYYGNNGLLEYDFVLSPGADPGVLGLRVSGADKIRADVSGNLLLQARNGTVQLQKPTIYQETSGVRNIIEGKFILRADNEVGFIVYDYDRTKPLVVDPVLSYSTLIGANNSTQVQGVAVDPSGNVIIAGTTYATNYPTVAAFQPTNHGTSNVFITKLNPAGNVILYSTYLGGSAFDTGRAIAVDSAGNAYVTGSANSADFPTTPGAFDTTCPGFCNTSFVTKVLPDGALGYSTFMGGVTGASAIAVDLAGAAYITGTAASGLPLVNAFQSAPAGGFAQKLKPDGTALDYSTYLGGGGDWGRGIAVDTSGSAYVVGSTTATNFPLKNPLQASLLDYPLSNAFITKFSPDGTSLAFSTYLGGTSPFSFSYAGDVATSVAIDPLGNIHITGTSSSCEFPLSLNAFSTDCVNTGYDQKVFVVILNSAGSQMLSSTFLQSGQGGSAPGIAVDKSGNSYVAGTTTSSNYPVLNPIETSQQASSNGFVTELDPSGKLLFSTYLGENSPGLPGYGADIAGVTVDSKGGIYIAGAGQADFPLLHPILNQVIQPQVFVAKISPGKSPQFSLSPRMSPMLALRNVSSVPLTISSLIPSSNFTMGGDCGTSLAPGRGCDLILIGADDKKTSGTVTITSNAYTTPQKFTISKSPGGDSLGLFVSIFPTFVQFPPQFIGTTSAAQRIVVKNLGLPAAINSISIIQPAAFTETNDCPALLNTAASCAISVTYSAATGQDAAQLAIVHDPNQTQDTVYLSGPGSASAIAASTGAVEFGSQQVGAPALARIINLSNTTPYPAVITSLSASTAYAQTNTCTSALSPHKECRVSVTFAPTGNQDAPGTLTVSNYGPGGPETINLHATGIQPGDLVLSPASLSFFGYVGFKSGPDTVTVTNNTQSSVTINVGGIKASAPFSQTHTCTSSLAPASSCQISVFFKATQPGAASGTLQVPFVGAGSPQSIALTGTAQTTVQFYPLSVQFGEQPVKVSSSQMTMFVENNGPTKVTLGSVSIQGSDFSIAQNNCGTTLARNTGCILEVVFTPSATGGRTGTMSVTASDSSSPHTATLQGTGISNGIGTLSSSTLSFGTQKVGTQSKPQQVTFTNTGTGTLTLNSIAISPQLFTQSKTCGSSLAAGAHCTFSVQFAPTLQGLLAGSLSIQDDGSVGQHTVVLSGIGQ